MVKISACVIVKNEENNIIKWLNCMEKLADEMIVVDTGSIDNTIEIAKKNGAQVFNFKWNNDFSSAKNFAIDQSTGDWIVFLDADEYFAEESIIFVRKFIEEQDSNDKIDAMICEIININPDANNRIISSFYNLRIFRNKPYLRYINKVHEMISKKNGALNLLKLSKEVQIYHTGYGSTIVKKKLERNLEIIKKDIEDNGNQEWHYGYLCDCYFGLGDYEEAIKYADLAIKSDSKLIGKETNAYRRMIDSLMIINEKHEKIIDIIEEAISKFPQLPEFTLDKAVLLLREKNYILAEQLLLSLVDINYDKCNNLFIDTFEGKKNKVCDSLAYIYKMKNKLNKSVEYYRKALEIQKYDKEAILGIYKIIGEDNQVEFIEILNNIYGDTKNDLNFLYETFTKTKISIYYKHLLRKKYNEIKLENEIEELFLAKQYKKLSALLPKILDEGYSNLLACFLLNGNCDKLEELSTFLPYKYNLAMETLHLKNENCEDDEVVEIVNRIKKEISRFEDFCIDNSYNEELITIILVNNDNENTLKCIERIKQYTKLNYEIILVEMNQENVFPMKDSRISIAKIEGEIIQTYNKVLKKAKGDYFLLINGDILVTENYLEKMINGLKSNDNVVAVGPLFNNIAGQSIDGCNNSISLNSFSKEIENKYYGVYSKRLSLDGNCILFKNNILDIVGAFDSSIEEDAIWDDYSCQIISKGFEMLLINDTFVFNTQNGYYRKSYDSFVKKWGFDFFYSNGCRHDLLQLIEVKKKDINVLDIGCACGGTLLEVKNINPTANLYGIEINKSSAAIAKHFANVSSADVESSKLPYAEKFFDYIICGDVLEHLYDPKKVLENIKPYLKDGGKIVASIPNIQHWTIIKELFNGNWTYADSGILDKTHLRFFTKSEITKLFDKAGYNVIQYIGKDIGVTESSKDMLENLMKNKLVNRIDDFMVYQWLLEAEKKYSLGEEYEKDILILLQNLDNDINKIEIIEEIRNFIISKKVEYKYLIDLIDLNLVNKVKIILKISFNMYDNNENTNSIKLLIEGYKKYSYNAEIIYTLAYLLNLNGDKDSAIKLLDHTTLEDENIQNLLKELKEV